MKEIISCTFTEIHNHLRATDDKRDKLVNLYFILVIAVLSAALAIFSDSDGTLAAHIYVVIATFLFLEGMGYLVNASELSSRKWHAEYMNCSVLIQGLSHYLEDNSNSYSINRNAWKELVRANEPPVKFEFDRFTTRSLKTTQIAMVFLKIVFVLAVWKFKDEIDDFDFSVALLLVLILFLLQGYRYSQSKIDLKKAQVKFWENPWESWIMSGLKEKSING